MTEPRFVAMRVEQGFGPVGLGQFGIGDRHGQPPTAGLRPPASTQPQRGHQLRRKQREIATFPALGQRPLVDLALVPHWRQLLLTLEQRIVLADACPGMLAEGEATGDTSLAQTARRTTRLDMRPFTIDTGQGRRQCGGPCRSVLTGRSHTGRAAGRAPGAPRRMPARGCGRKRAPPQTVLSATPTAGARTSTGQSPAGPYLSVAALEMGGTSCGALWPEAGGTRNAAFRDVRSSQRGGISS